MTSYTTRQRPLTLANGLTRVSEANRYRLYDRKLSKLSGQTEYSLKVMSKVFYMGEAFNAASLEWEPVRPDIAHGVYGKTLLADGVKIVLTRVAVSGRFDTHQDNYGHLFYFLSGNGLVWIQDKQFKTMPGLVVRVAAGEPHAYENKGNQDLVLISVNIPMR